MKMNKFVKLLISFFALVSLGGSFTHTRINTIETKADNKGAVLDSILWNNVVYDEGGVFIPSKAFGECNTSGNPKDGYVVLVSFKNADGSTAFTDISKYCNPSSEESMRETNLAKEAFASSFKINGKSMSEVEGAGLYVYFGLLFYLPHDSLIFDETYEIPTINLSVQADLGFQKIEPFSLGFKGTKGMTGGWELIKDKSLMRTIEFTGVAGSQWNNTGVSPTERNTILAFGENTPDHIDYLRETHTTDGLNLVTAKSDVGLMFKINGIPFKDIPGVQVNYMHGNNYVYIVLPITALIPSNGYRVVTFTVDEGCMFYDVLLGEVTLYLFNNQWQETCPSYPENTEFEGAPTISTICGDELICLDETNSSHAGEYPTVPGEFKLFFEYLLETEDDSFTAYLFGNEDKNGIKFVARENSVSIFDSTSNNTSIGSAELKSFSYGDWNSVLVYGKVESGTIEIKVAIDGINYIETPAIYLDNSANIGKKINFYSNNGTVLLRDAVLDRDIKKPMIIYYGKKVYGVKLGTEKLDFTIRCVAVDLIDGDITNKLVITWEDGALTNNLINEGEWNVLITVSDNAGNTAKISVIVICRDELSATVSFDNKNSIVYTIGDCIAKPEDPVSDKSNEEFVGWYYNGKPWDFENDCISQDMNLEPKFKSNIKEYAVTAKVTGLDTSDYIIYFKEGTLVNVSIFEIDGYSMTASFNNENISSFRVNGDLIINLNYQKLVEEEKKGCRGSIDGGLLTLLASGLFASILLVSKKKEEK